MITTKLRNVVNSTLALNVLLNVERMPVKASYAISKLSDACAKELQQYDKTRTKVFVDAGCVIDGPQYTHEDPVVMKACAADIEDLLDLDVEISANPLSLEQFGNTELPGKAFSGLGWAIKED